MITEMIFVALVFVGALAGICVVVWRQEVEMDVEGEGEGEGEGCGSRDMGDMGDGYGNEIETEEEELAARLLYWEKLRKNR